MKNDSKKIMQKGAGCLLAFMVWTLLVQYIDVKPVGVNGTDVGFATLNIWFHNLTDVNMNLYIITDWLSIIPVAVCAVFGLLGLKQLVERKSLLKVDRHILILGVYYAVVIFTYRIFEKIPVNYRPVLIDGVMEISYPSSTTLLVLSVMPTLDFNIRRILPKSDVDKSIKILSAAFSLFMVISRLISGVHWVTDIIAAVMLSKGLLYFYKAAVYYFEIKR